MKQNLGLMMKIIGKSTFKFVSVLIFGMAFCILSIVVAYYYLAHHADEGSVMGHTGHTGSVAVLVLVWFKLDFWSAILFFSSLLVFPFLYFTVANKTAVQTAIHLLWSNKLSDWIGPKITYYLQKLEAQQPNWMKTTTDSTVVELKLLEANKNDAETPALQRKVIAFLLKKVRLDDVDFQKDTVSISSILSEKLINTLSDVASPSNTLLWIVFGVHFLLFLIPIVV
jgi:hypothetical protein